MTDTQLIFMSDVCRDIRMTDRGLRKAIAAGRFPPPDGKLNRRNFWRLATYRAWHADVAAGRYAIASTLPRAA